MINSRRRLLGFLGLLGLPATAWAKTEDGPPSISCSADRQVGDSVLTYFNVFNLVKQRLSGEKGKALIDVKLAPTEVNLKAPLAPGQLPAEKDPDKLTMPMLKTGLQDNALKPVEFQFTILLSDDYTDVPNISVTLGRLNPTKDQILNDMNFEPEGVVWRNLTSNQKRITVTGKFFGEDRIVREGPVRLDVAFDFKPVGEYIFDASQMPWKAFMAEQDAAFLSAKSVILNDDGKTNVPGCERSGDCFFTTAAVDTLGLKDDCWELRTLRAFRDGPLCGSADGRALVARYYTEAPRLVARVGRQSRAARIWLHAYWGYILPCAVLARMGLNRPAVAHYTRLFNWLDSLSA